MPCTQRQEEVTWDWGPANQRLVPGQNPAQKGSGGEGMRTGVAKLLLLLISDQGFQLNSRNHGATCIQTDRSVSAPGASLEQPVGTHGTNEPPGKGVWHEAYHSTGLRTSSSLPLPCSAITRDVLLWLKPRAWGDQAD